MSERQETGKPAAAPAGHGDSQGGEGGDQPATLGQKVFLVVLYLYVASLVWLVLSHHWYGVLPQWLDPH